MPSLKISRFDKEIWFVIFLLVALGVYFTQTLGLKRLASQAPIVVIIPIALLLLLRLVALIKQGLKSENVINKSVSNAQEIDETKKSKFRSSILFGWLMGLIISIYIVGQYISVFLFLFLFLRFQSKKSWIFSSVGSIVVLGFLYLVLGVILDTDMYEGFIFMYHK